MTARYGDAYQSDLGGLADAFGGYATMMGQREGGELRRAQATKVEQETTSLARLAEVEAGFERGDYTNMENMQKANWMASLGMTPLKTTAIADNEAYNPYLNPDQNITMTPRGREEMDLAEALNRANVRTEGAHQGAYNAAAGASRASMGATQQDTALQKRIQSGEITIGDALAYKLNRDQMVVGGAPVPDQPGTPDKPRSYAPATEKQVEQAKVLIGGFGGERARNFKKLSAKQQEYMVQMFSTEVNRATTGGHPVDPRAVFDELWRMHDGKFTPDTSPWYRRNNAESTLGNTPADVAALPPGTGYDMRNGVLYKNIPSGAEYIDPKGVNRTKP